LDQSSALGHRLAGSCAGNRPSRISQCPPGNGFAGRAGRDRVEPVIEKRNYHPVKMKLTNRMDQAEDYPINQAEPGLNPVWETVG
jgi:hypothetical protein